MKLLKNGIVILLSLMVFITSSGLTVNLHYCVGKLQNVSLNPHQSDCNMMDMAASNCHNENQKNLKAPSDCCQNHQIIAKSGNKINDKKAKKEDSLLTTFTFIKSYFVSLFNFNSSDDNSNQEEKDISLVPLLKEGLIILLQQFRN
ncbi:MAG: hypothetical protein IE931_05155 [Sphingobacteriales bacterium]|nr:hypothetical protein [Sphingobacteriales bacterium]